MIAALKRVRAAWRGRKTAARAFAKRHARPLLLIFGMSLLAIGVAQLQSALQAYSDDRTYESSHLCPMDSSPACYAMWPGTIVSKPDQLVLVVASATRGGFRRPSGGRIWNW
jgi:hypothetical protein